MSTSENTRSCWMDQTLPVAPVLDSDLSADVCIVGAGIAGLTTAYLLAKEGLSVVVLDRAGIGEGQTQRTSAHLSDAIDDRYQEVERIHGPEGAALAAESHSQAIDWIEATVRQENIDCAFERVDGYLCLAPGQSAELLREEWEACRRTGLTDVIYETGRTFGALTGVDRLRFSRQGQFHPLKYLDGLSRRFVERGGRIYCRNAVHHVQGGAGAYVETEQGRRVSCGAIVVATNTPINDLVAIHTKQAPYRSYVIAAPIPPGTLAKALYWDTEDPYHYVRLQDDLLIIGGEDHKTGQDDPEADHFASLEAWARRRFPQLGSISYRWSGQVMETVDGLAFIGRNPLDDDNVFIATGDSGMGLTHGTIAGLLLRELIRGRDHRWARLYDPSRKPLRAAGAYTLENVNVAWQYADWVSPGDVSAEAEIAPGDGAVVRRGLHKLAVYRDEAGQVHECSAVCTHLGCIVRWNGVEKTWDCPCHGSRFDRHGQVITGPATANLSPPEATADPHPIPATSAEG